MHNLSKYYDSEYGELFRLFDKVLNDLKTLDKQKYKEFECDLYIAINGYHFNEELLQSAFEDMINDDGSVVPKWSLEQAKQIAKTNNIMFDDFNEFDWCYVLNMMFSDYSSIFGDNLTYYTKLAIKFLEDKDAPDGKALRYYMSLK